MRTSSCGERSVAEGIMLCRQKYLSQFLLESLSPRVHLHECAETYFKVRLCIKAKQFPKGWKEYALAMKARSINPSRRAGRKGSNWVKMCCLRDFVIPVSSRIIFLQLQMPSLVSFSPLRTPVLRAGAETRGPPWSAAQTVGADHGHTHPRQDAQG